MINIKFPCFCRQGLLRRNNVVYSSCMERNLPLVITMGGGYSRPSNGKATIAILFVQNNSAILNFRHRLQMVFPEVFNLLTSSFFSSFINLLPPDTNRLFWWWTLLYFRSFNWSSRRRLSFSSFEVQCCVSWAKAKTAIVHVGPNCSFQFLELVHQIFRYPLAHIIWSCERQP